jgi:hypothetical protein
LCDVTPISSIAVPNKWWVCWRTRWTVSCRGYFVLLARNEGTVLATTKQSIKHT